jgi:putative DNA primase/helicase
LKVEKDPFDVAKVFIEGLKQGTSPLLKPWKAGEIVAPHNPVSGTSYRGINFVNLFSKGYNDPRWMTFKQAKSKDYEILKGERGTRIQFFKPLDEEKSSSEEKEESKKGKYRSLIVYTTVFNATQIRGIEPYVPETPSFNNEKIESIITNSSVLLKHDQSDKAFYKISEDTIHLPNKSQFNSETDYYSVLLHEMSHWTGHESRLKREIGNPFGSDKYALEEIRAEIASFMLAAELGLGYDPQFSIGYVNSWIKVLSDNPQEIIKATGDSSKIVKFISAFLNTQLPQKISINNKYRVFSNPFHVVVELNAFKIIDCNLLFDTNSFELNIS